MSFRAVAFDVDGTLYPNSRMYLRTAMSAAKRLRFLYFFARIRRQIRAIRPIHDFELLQSELLAEAMGVSPERAAELVELWINREWGGALSGIRPYPHVKRFIERLRERGLKLGVLSDFPVHRKLEMLGLDGYWDCVLSAQDTGYLKPNPEPFLELAGCLGVEPGSMVYIGNNHGYDIVGASGVGMTTVHIASKTADASIADVTCSGYEHLEEELFELVNN